MALDNVNLNKPTTKASMSESNKTRPGANPKAEKNFRKVLTASDGEQEDVVDAEDLDENPDDKTSLFALSAGKSTLKNTKPIITKRPLFGETSLSMNPDALEASEEDIPSQLPSTHLDLVSEEELAAEENEDLEAESGINTFKPQSSIVKTDNSLDEAGRMTTAVNVNKKGKADGGYAFEADSSELGSKKIKVAVKETRTEFTEENPDLAAVNSNRQSVAPLLADKAQVEDQETQSSIKDLAAKIIEKIQSMRSEGKTDTIVTLRSPPILAGSVITLSATDVAKREFNISFTGLTDAGKMFLDRKLTEDNLTQTLERKGIIVHTLTTTTLVEAPIPTDTENKFGRDQQREDQQRRDQRQSQNQEEEENS